VREASVSKKFYEIKKTSVQNEKKVSNRKIEG
jgi:hypothetical protein